MVFFTNHESYNLESGVDIMDYGIEKFWIGRNKLKSKG